MEFSEQQQVIDVSSFQYANERNETGKYKNFVRKIAIERLFDAVWVEGFGVKDNWLWKKLKVVVFDCCHLSEIDGV